MSSELQALKTEIEKIDAMPSATFDQRCVQSDARARSCLINFTALLSLAEDLQARLKVAETALLFYKDSWHYDMIGTGEQGSTMSLWEPDRELLDDGGERATAALAEIRREG